MSPDSCFKLWFDKQQRREASTAMMNQGTPVPHGKLGLRDILGVRPGDDLNADKLPG